MKPKKWTTETIESLRIDRAVNNMSAKALAKKYTTSVGAIYAALSRFNISTPQYHWSDKEKQYVIDNYATMQVSDIAKKLNRTPDAVITQANILGVNKYKPWTTADNRMVAEFYPRYGSKHVAKKLNRPRGAVRAQATRLGIRRHYVSE